MTLNRDILDQYLDGELAAGQLAEVEQGLRADAAAGMLLEQIRRERALRSAALRTYAPGAQELRGLTEKLQMALDEANAPLAKIGGGRMWVSRFAGVAAMLLIAAGWFWVGRVSSTPGTSNGATPGYVVSVVSSEGVISTHDFGTLPEAKKFAENIAKQTTSETQVADVGPGIF